MNPHPLRYLLSNETRVVADDDSAEKATSHVNGSTNSVPQDNDDDAPPPGKRQRLSKQEKKKRTGANKGRRYVKMRDEVELCWKLANGEACELGEEYVCINV